MGNDGVGLKVIEALKNALKKTELKGLEGLVEIVDAGTCGLDMLNLLDGTRKVIIIDAVLAGGLPGSIYRFSGQEILENSRSSGLVSIHDIGISEVLKIGEKVQNLPEILIYGIEIGEPATEFSLGLSPEVSMAVDETMKLILEEISRFNGKI